MKRQRAPAVGDTTSDVVPLGGHFAALDRTMLATEVLSRLSTASLGRLACTCRGLRALAAPFLRAQQQMCVQTTLLNLQQSIVLVNALFDGTYRALWTIVGGRRLPIPLGFDVVMREQHGDPEDDAPPIAWARDGSVALPWPGTARPWRALMWTYTRDLFDRIKARPQMLDVDMWERLQTSVVDPVRGRTPRDTGSSSASDALITALLHAVPVDGVRPHVAFVCTVKPRDRNAVAMLGSLQQLTYVMQEYDLASGETRDSSLEVSDIGLYARHTLAGSHADAPPGKFLRLPPAVARQHQTTHALRSGFAS